LRRLSAHDGVRVFRPGDFLLTSSDAGLARLLGWATGHTINHAGIIVDPTGAVVEANPTLLADARMFQLTTVADYLKAGKPCWIGYVELREGSRQDVVAYAHHLLVANGRVSGSGQLWQALQTVLSVAPRAWTRRAPWLRPLHHLFDRHALVVHEEHYFSSGEFVARALERGGFIWDRDPAHVTPADLFERYHLADAPVRLAPKSLRMVRSVERVMGGERGAQGSPATITRLAARPTRGATALVEDPHSDEPLHMGVRALVHVGVFMAAGLAVISVIEEMLRDTARNA
jgi:hypothetical protein